jgi:lipoprotein-anchoring transpeptidase ErfK/SrfK
MIDQVIGFALNFNIAQQTLEEQTLHKAAKHLQTNAVELHQEETWCNTAINIDDRFEAEIIHVGFDPVIHPGEFSKVVIRVTNKGTRPWYGENTDCATQPKFRLATARSNNRNSIFAPSKDIIDAQDKLNWITANRVAMQQKVVKPLEVASFEFYMAAPQENDVYAEFFQPIIEDTHIYYDQETKLTFTVGEASEEQQKWKDYLVSSTPTSQIDLDQRNILVDISDQKMYARLGERVIYTFPVSSGTYKTPTPLGTSEIFFKQTVRVGGKAPHYIMPRFMAFSANGAYGIHALPSLSTDGGVYWREALNHIGQQRSHGCIRLLPEDADKMFEVTDAGVPIVIQE